MSTQSLWAADALWPGALIVARLRQQVPALAEVMPIDAYDPDLTQPRQLPAAVVLLDDMRPLGRPASKVAAVEQDWLIAIAVRSPGREADANAQRFGPLIPQVVSAMQGWVPSGTQRGFAWRARYRPSYGRDVSYFPLLFAIEIVTA